MWTVNDESPDVPDVTALIREYFAELTVRYFKRPTDEDEIDLTLEEFPADGLGTFLVLRSDGVAAGHLGVYPTGELTRFYVSPEYRRGGGGRALLAAAETWARARGLPRLFSTPAPTSSRRAPSTPPAASPRSRHPRAPRASSRTTGSRSPCRRMIDRLRKHEPSGRLPGSWSSRYVIFDLDDTLVHSDAVREAFAIVADAFGIDREHADADAGRPSRAPRAGDLRGARPERRAWRSTPPTLPGRARRAQPQAPPVAYPDADTTLRELAAHGAQLMLSTGSSPERAQQVLDDEGWDAFTSCSARTSAAARAPPTTTASRRRRPRREWTQPRGHGGRQPAGHAPRRGARRADPDRRRPRRRSAPAVRRRRNPRCQRAGGHRPDRRIGRDCGLT